MAARWPAELGREVVMRSAAARRVVGAWPPSTATTTRRAQQVAHHARTITMSDPDQLKALIEAERPDVVVPEIEAIATAALEELEDGRRHG